MYTYDRKTPNAFYHEKKLQNFFKSLNLYVNNQYKHTIEICESILVIYDFNKQYYIWKTKFSIELHSDSQSINFHADFFF